mgnify:CR=1 FL=1
MTLANAFGSGFNKDSLRIRTFVLNNNTFKVKVPLTAETEAMFDRIRNVDEAKAEEHYQRLAGEFVTNPDKYKADPDIEYLENDIKVKGISVRETARNKVITENRITEMVRLLVPESPDFDMSQVTYQDIDELFPFPVQLELVEEIASIISPTYKPTRGK